MKEATVEEVEGGRARKNDCILSLYMHSWCVSVRVHTQNTQGRRRWYLGSFNYSESSLIRKLESIPQIFRIIFVQIMLTFLLGSGNYELWKSELYFATLWLKRRKYCFFSGLNLRLTRIYLVKLYWLAIDSLGELMMADEFGHFFPILFIQMWFRFPLCFEIPGNWGLKFRRWFISIKIFFFVIRT